MKKIKVLLTGGSGRLGQAIINSGLFPLLHAPPRDALDITEPQSLKSFFNKNDIGIVIHCAAVARMKECEINPLNALKTNIVGTCNIVSEILEMGKEGKRIRLVLISTDGVYPGASGNYSETSETIPYNRYGWTKLGAECAARMLRDFCIIRTSFFDPENIPFESSPTDAFSSKMPVKNLVKAIYKMAYSGFIGAINIGSDRKSEYERYKEYKPSLQKCSADDVIKSAGFPIARDASMNCSLWKSLQDKKRSAI